VAAIIDTSVLVAAERGALDLDALLRSRPDEEVMLAAITASELLHGVHRMKGAVARAHAHVFVDRLLNVLPVLPFDLEVARVHALLSAELSSRGTPIGAHDLLIAATAVHAGAAVATRDRRSFPRIRGLRIDSW